MDGTGSETRRSVVDLAALEASMTSKRGRGRSPALDLQVEELRALCTSSDFQAALSRRIRAIARFPPEVLDDIRQDVLTTVLSSLSRLRDRSPTGLLAWSTGIARNLISQHFRAARPFSGRQPGNASPTPAQEDHEESSQREPNSSARRAARVDTLRRLLSSEQLDPLQRVGLVLRFGFCLRRASQRTLLGIPTEGARRQFLSRARRAARSRSTPSECSVRRRLGEAPSGARGPDF